MYLMIFHVLSQAVRGVLDNIRYKKQAEEYSKVKFVQHKITVRLRKSFRPHDFECFDPPFPVQLYETVKEILLVEKWRHRIKKVVQFGDGDPYFVKMYLRRMYHVSEIVSVADREFLGTDDWMGPYPKTFDVFWAENRPRRTHFYVGRITQPDPRLLRTDAVVALELLHHVYPDVLEALVYNVFAYIRPLVVIFTTVDYDFIKYVPQTYFNRVFNNKSVKHLWNKEQFHSWAKNICVRYPDYMVRFHGVGPGPADPDCCHTQVAIFFKYTGDNAVLKDEYSHGICTYKNSKPLYEPYKTRASSLEFPYFTCHRVIANVSAVKIKQGTVTKYVVFKRCYQWGVDWVRLTRALCPDEEGYLMINDDVKAFLKSIGFTMEKSELAPYRRKCWIISVPTHMTGSSSLKTITQRLEYEDIPMKIKQSGEDGYYLPVLKERGEPDLPAHENSLFPWQQFEEAQFLTEDEEIDLYTNPYWMLIFMERKADRPYLEVENPTMEYQQLRAKEIDDAFKKKARLELEALQRYIRENGGVSFDAMTEEEKIEHVLRKLERNKAKSKEQVPDEQQLQQQTQEDSSSDQSDDSFITLRSPPGERRRDLTTEVRKIEKLEYEAMCEILRREAGLCMEQAQESKPEKRQHQSEQDTFPGDVKQSKRIEQEPHRDSAAHNVKTQPAKKQEPMRESLIQNQNREPNKMILEVRMKGTKLEDSMKERPIQKEVRFEQRERAKVTEQPTRIQKLDEENLQRSQNKRIVEQPTISAAISSNHKNIGNMHTALAEGVKQPMNIQKQNQRKVAEQPITIQKLNEENLQRSQNKRIVEQPTISAAISSNHKNIGNMHTALAEGVKQPMNIQQQNQRKVTEQPITIQKLNEENLQRSQNKRIVEPPTISAVIGSNHKNIGNMNKELAEDVKQPTNIQKQNQRLQHQPIKTTQPVLKEATNPIKIRQNDSTKPLPNMQNQTNEKVSQSDKSEFKTILRKQLEDELRSDPADDLDKKRKLEMQKERLIMIYDRVIRTKEQIKEIEERTETFRQNRLFFESVMLDEIWMIRNQREKEEREARRIEANKLMDEVDELRTVLELRRDLNIPYTIAQRKEIWKMVKELQIDYLYLTADYPEDVQELMDEQLVDIEALIKVEQMKLVKQYGMWPSIVAKKKTEEAKAENRIEEAKAENRIEEITEIEMKKEIPKVAEVEIAKGVEEQTEKPTEEETDEGSEEESEEGSEEESEEGTEEETEAESDEEIEDESEEDSDVTDPNEINRDLQKKNNMDELLKKMESYVRILEELNDISSQFQEGAPDIGFLESALGEDWYAQVDDLVMEPSLQKIVEMLIKIRQYGEIETISKQNLEQGQQKPENVSQEDLDQEKREKKSQQDAVKIEGGNHQNKESSQGSQKPREFTPDLQRIEREVMIQKLNIYLQYLDKHRNVGSASQNKESNTVVDEEFLEGALGENWSAQIDDLVMNQTIDNITEMLNRIRKHRSERHLEREQQKSEQLREIVSQQDLDKERREKTSLQDAVRIEGRDYQNEESSQVSEDPQEISIDSQLEEIVQALIRNLKFYYFKIVHGHCNVKSGSRDEESDSIGNVEFLDNVLGENWLDQLKDCLMDSTSQKVDEMLIKIHEHADRENRRRKRNLEQTHQKPEQLREIVSKEDLDKGKSDQPFLETNMKQPHIEDHGSSDRENLEQRSEQPQRETGPDIKSNLGENHVDCKKEYQEKESQHQRETETNFDESEQGKKSQRQHQEAEPCIKPNLEQEHQKPRGQPEMENQKDFDNENQGKISQEQQQETKACIAPNSEQVQQKLEQQQKIESQDDLDNENIREMSQQKQQEIKAGIGPNLELEMRQIGSQQYLDEEDQEKSFQQEQQSVEACMESNGEQDFDKEQQEPKELHGIDEKPGDLDNQERTTGSTKLDLEVEDEDWKKEEDTDEDLAYDTAILDDSNLETHCLDQTENGDVQEEQSVEDYEIGSEHGEGRNKSPAEQQEEASEEDNDKQELEVEYEDGSDSPSNVEENGKNQTE